MLGPRVVEICRQGQVSLENANKAVAIIWRFTLKYSEHVDRLIAQLEAIDHSHLDLVNDLESEINDLINSWHTKVQKLGGSPKGLWMADFDAGDGYFSWKFPERAVGFWRTYNDGFIDRIPIERRLGAKSSAQNIHSKTLCLS